MGTTPSGKAIDAAYLLKQLQAYDIQVATVKYNEKFQLSTMPTAEAKYVGKYIQYIGETDATYTNGYFYKGIQTADGESPSYKWEAVTQSAPEYTIKKESSPSGDDYSATYKLYKDDVAIGDEINIPKDFFVSDAITGVVIEADKQEGGKFADKADFSVGDTYIELDVSLKDKSEPKPVYINTKGLVDIYEAGDGIVVDANTKKISAKLTTNGGLKFGALEGSDTEKGVAIDFETTDIDFDTQW